MIEDFSDVDAKGVPKAERVPLKALDDLMVHDVTSAGESAHQASHENQVSREQKIRILREVLAELPEKDNRLLTLRFGFDDDALGEVRSYEEVGEMLSLKGETIREQIIRAQRKLYARLEQQYHGVFRDFSDFE